jgi:hypothetical protein
MVYLSVPVMVGSEFRPRMGRKKGNKSNVRFLKSWMFSLEG